MHTLSSKCVVPLSMFCISLAFLLSSCTGKTPIITSPGTYTAGFIHSGAYKISSSGSFIPAAEIELPEHGGYLAAGDLMGSGGKELLYITGQNVYIYDAGGELQKNAVSSSLN